MLSLATIQKRPLHWLWPNHFPLGKLSLLVGEQGAGKSFVALDIAARVSAGLPWPNLPDRPTEAGGVLLLTEPDDLPDVTLPRLEAAGADLGRIMVLPVETERAASATDDTEETSTGESPPSFTLPDGLKKLEQAILDAPACRLVIIDPLSAFLPQSGGRKRPDLPAIFQQLAALAARTGVAIVAVASYLASTSAAANHRAAARLAALPGLTCVWRITADKEDPECRLLLPLKNNLAPKNPTLPFTLQTTPEQAPPSIAWQPPPSEPNSTSPRISQLPTPNSELRTPNTAPNSELRTSTASLRTSLSKAQTWLTELLAGHDGQLPDHQVRNAAQVQGISPADLETARQQAQIRVGVSGFFGVTYWSLPQKTAQ